jgi:hypothetical protein
MPKKTDLIPDIRFSFNHIKPFANNRELFSKLETIIYNNVNNFRSVDWIKDCRSNNISSLKKRKIEGFPIKKSLNDIRPLAEYTKNILKEINKEVRLDSDLSKFINESISDSNQTGGNSISQSNNSQNEDLDENDLIGDSDDDDDENETGDNQDDVYSYHSSSKHDFDDFSQEMKFVDTDDVTTYTVVPGRLLSYQAVCELTKAIARSRLTVNIKKDDSIKYAEERERLKLKQELERYMKMTQIKADLSSNFNVDIDEMSLKQLQYYSGEAKALYERLKTTQIIIDGIDVVDKVQSTVFKDGIKIPGTKKAIKFNNIGGALKETIFNKQSSMYVATDNLIEKYNLHVSDELLAGLALLNTIFKSASIVDVKDKKKKDNKDKDDEDEDESDEDEDEDEDEKDKKEDNEESDDDEDESDDEDDEDEDEDDK